MIRLSDIRDSFEGVIPSIVATTDAAGVPNISYLSHVYYVDEQHVALSNQFFSKTAANVRSNGFASVMVVDGKTGAQHVLDLVFEESVESGVLFDRVAAHLEVISLEQGMASVMKLKAVDRYRVEHCRPVLAVAPLAEPAAADEDRRDHLALAAQLIQELAAQADAEALLDATLEGLRGHFGYENAMVLVPDESGRKLTTIASIGYPHQGSGAEIRFGTGAIGIAAAARSPVRISDMRRGRRYVAAISGATVESMDDIPFPALAEPLSQLAVPILSRGQLAGVLFVESAKSFAFGYRDEAVLTIVAAQLATGLTLAERERQDGEVHPEATLDISRPAMRREFHLRFFPHDGSVFIDGDYVIRGVPGRLLHHFIEAFATSGRMDFTNREIRRTPSLTLPDFKDNLETRLILLRRRLEEKDGPVKLLRPERGRIRLAVDGMPRIDIAEG